MGIFKHVPLSINVQRLKPKLSIFSVCLETLRDWFFRVLFIASSVESTTRRCLEFSTGVDLASFLTLDTQKIYHVKIVITCEKLILSDKTRVV